VIDLNQKTLYQGLTKLQQLMRFKNKSHGYYCSSVDAAGKPSGFNIS